MTAPDTAEQARAGLYRLLGVSLSAPPDTALLGALGSLDGDGPIGDALRAVAAVARGVTEEAARREYDALFIGMTRGELVPYASFYLTGFLHERPLARMRADMAVFGLAPADGRADPEDHIATILEVMSALISGDGLCDTLAPRSLARQHAFFRRHIDPWAARFFADLEAAAAARLYRPIGVVGRLLVELDRDAFALEAA